MGDKQKGSGVEFFKMGSGGVEWNGTQYTVDTEGHLGLGELLTFIDKVC